MKKQLVRSVYLLALCVVLGAAGCAGTGAIITNEQIANTEKSIAEARESNASVNAPLELKMAEEKLEAAKAAKEKKNYDQARYLIEEAQSDSDLALAKTSSAKTRKNAKELRDSVDLLGRELERHQQAQ